MHMVRISENQLKRIISNVIRESIESEGLFGPFNLGGKGKIGGKKKKDAAISKASWYGLQDNGEEIVYTNVNGEKVSISVRSGGLMATIGEKSAIRKNMFRDYDGLKQYAWDKKNGHTSDIPVWQQSDGGYLGDYDQEIPAKSYYLSSIGRSFDEARSELAAEEPNMAKGIYAWILKHAKSKNEISFLKRFIEKTGEPAFKFFRA